MTETDASRDGWLRALEELERELGAVLVSTGSTTESSITAWTPPGDLGPIPADLVERARELLAGQNELIAELEHSKRATAVQLAALRKMPTTRPTGASVYLDING
jgi:hypothetical protein